MLLMLSNAAGINLWSLVTSCFQLDHGMYANGPFFNEVLFTQPVSSYHGRFPRRRPPVRFYLELSSSLFANLFSALCSFRYFFNLVVKNVIKAVNVIFFRNLFNDQLFLPVLILTIASRASLFNFHSCDAALY